MNSIWNRSRLIQNFQICSLPVKLSSVNTWPTRSRWWPATSCVTRTSRGRGSVCVTPTWRFNDSIRSISGKHLSLYYSSFLIYWGEPARVKENFWIWKGSTFFLFLVSFVKISTNPKYFLRKCNFPSKSQNFIIKC